MLNEGKLYTDGGVIKNTYGTALASEGRVFLPSSLDLKNPHEGIYSPDIDHSGFLKTY